MTSVSLQLPPEVLEAIAERAAELLAGREPTEPAPWMSIDEASAYVGIPKQSLYKLTSAKAIPHAKPGNRLLFKREDLDAWIETHREGPVDAHTLRALPGGRR